MNCPNTSFLIVIAIWNALREPEVDDADVALPVEHHVLGLEVSVGHALGVDMRQRQHERRGVEADEIRGHSPETQRRLVYGGPQISVLEKLRHDDDVILCLVCSMKLQNELVVEHLEDFTLTGYMLKLLGLQDVYLALDLERNKGRCFLIRSRHYRSKTSAAHHVIHNKVVFCEGANK